MPLEQNNPGKYNTDSLFELYAQAFGRVGLPYPAARFNPNPNPIGTLDAIKDQYAKQPAPAELPPYGSFQNQSLLGSAFFMPTKLDGFQLWNEPLVSVSGRKSVVTTAVAGSQRRGSVKEIITIEDYEVRIRGIIVNERDRDAYPDVEVRQFRELYETNRAVGIDCLLLSLFGITQVVLTGFDFPEMEGFPGAQAYSITALSEDPFEFELQSPLNRL